MFTVQRCEDGTFSIVPAIVIPGDYHPDNPQKTSWGALVKNELGDQFKFDGYKTKEEANQAAKAFGYPIDPLSDNPYDSLCRLAELTRDEGFYGEFYRNVSPELRRLVNMYLSSAANIIEYWVNKKMSE